MKKWNAGNAIDILHIIDRTTKETLSETLVFLFRAIVILIDKFLPNDPSIPNVSLVRQNAQNGINWLTINTQEISPTKEWPIHKSVKLLAECPELTLVKDVLEEIYYLLSLPESNQSMLFVVQDSYPYAKEFDNFLQCTATERERKIDTIVGRVHVLHDHLIKILPS